MLKQQWGRIINVASIAGSSRVGGRTALRAVRGHEGGMMGLTRELAASWGRQGIRVNAIAPGSSTPDGRHRDRDDGVRDQATSLFHASARPAS
jgi:NAD(P)-dependent dehydrogenase (short-subunit alcohol dehydrogenase family)